MVCTGRPRALALIGLIAMLAVAAFAPPTAAQSGATIYVDPARGDDAWSGLRPNPRGGDGPLATLGRARDLARTLAGRGPVTVSLRGGLYETAGLRLGPADSGAPGAPIVYRAYQDEEPILTAGRAVPATAWSDQLPQEVRDRLPEAARPHVRALDLGRLGATDTGALTTRAWNLWPTPLPMEPIFDGRPGQLARFPNADDGEYSYLRYGPSLGERSVGLGAYAERAARWRPGEWWMACFCDVVWGDYHYRVEAADGGLRLDPGDTNRPIRGNGRSYIYNLLEELDAPGEYFIDRQSLRLYAWPPQAGRVVLTTNEAPVIALDGARHVQFEGLTIEGGRAGGMRIGPASEAIVLRALTFRATGLAALDIEGRNVTVERSRFEDVEAGIEAGGGDRRTLQPSGIRIGFNSFTRTGRWLRTYQQGVSLNGVGTHVYNNLFVDLPHAAISVVGNNHLIERNEFANVVSDSGDMGAIYTHRSWANLGTVVRHNFIHSMPRNGARGSARVGIYLDSSIIGWTVEGNIVDTVEVGLHVRGYLNTITNNLITRSGSFGAAYLMGGPQSALARVLPALEQWPYREPPWSTSYPELLAWLERYRQDASVARHPTQIRFQHNVFWANELDIATWAPYLDDPHFREVYQVELAPNAFEGRDPGWVVREGDTVRLRRGRTSFAGISFEPIPVEQIGPGASGPPPLRASPTAQPPGPTATPGATTTPGATATAGPPQRPTASPPPRPPATATALASPTARPTSPTASPAPPRPTPTPGEPAPGPELLRNGNFEEEWEGWLPKTIDIGERNMHPQAARDGVYGALIRGAGRVQQDVRGLEPNTTYTFFGYVKSLSGASRSGLYVRDYGGPEREVFTAGSGAFELLSITFTTGPAHTLAEVGFYAPEADDHIHYADDLSFVAGAP